MDNRWHMNRMGFVNFWLYDEETFSFSDGKLLLRGQNGSGKSITTQSFIPFILDGDRTPSRLDPFGSSDRKMEYYFLGEGRKEESTGYLFMEFKKENTHQYRTIGIGQRAQKGKALTFWGFLLLDGRRIGYDLELYKTVGSNKIPHTKKELKELLGEESLFTESQREYMEIVNNNIFGFNSLEQYNQFIKLLIKVRAPKLSKEFKPTRVYEILNDSLQTLSDEDMRAMVDAMEKMDEIQDRLDSMKAAFEDTKVIYKEYQRYNTYMLSKKAQAYIEEKRKVDTQKGRLEQGENELESIRTEIAARNQTAEELYEEESILLKEKEVLHIENLESLAETLQTAKKAQDAAKTEKKDAEVKIETSRILIADYDRRMHEAKESVKAFHSKIQQCIKQLDEENRTLQLNQHGKLAGMESSVSRQEDMEELNHAVKTLGKAVEEGEKALKELRQSQQDLDREEEKLQKIMVQRDYAKKQCEESERLEDTCRDHLIEQYHVLRAESHEMKMSSEELALVVQKIHHYREPSDSTKIRELIADIWKRRYEHLSAQKLKWSAKRKTAQQEHGELENELEQIRNMTMPLPSQNRRREEARNRLREKGISFMPFYEAVEFTGNTAQEMRDNIECQMTDAGLLDALVVPEKSYDDARKVLSELSDVIIHPEGNAENRYPYLVSADLADAELKQETDRILRYIHQTRESFGFVLEDSGYFRNGILEGYSHASEEASYIGTAARKRKKEKMLRQKEEELKRKEEELSACEKEIEQSVLRIEKLQQEYSSFPSFNDLDQAQDLLRQSGKELENCTRLSEEQEQAVLRIKDQCKQSEQKVIRICKPLPFKRSVDAYQDISDTVERYKDELKKLEHLLLQFDHETNQHVHAEELMQKEEDLVDSRYDDIRRAKKIIRETEMQIVKINEYLDDPQIKEKTRRLKELLHRLAEIAEETRTNGNALAVCGSNLTRITGEIEELKKIVALQIGTESKACQYFTEELSLKLLLEQESGSVLELAEKAQGLTREGDRQRSGIEMTASLMRIFQSHLNVLSSYGAVMEDCFEGDDSSMLRSRQRIAFIWNGQKLYLQDFFTVLKESIEGTELLILQKDRELFEGILADTLSRKLSGRIRESRSWIKDMSALMKNMDTSMALTFSLDWKPKTAEGEQELDTQELEKILSREKALLTDEDIQKVSYHFRNKIHSTKQSAEENGEMINYMDLVRDALDYRKWFEFRMSYYRSNENRKELTNGAFNRFSGGEKAMAMYVPLFAAVNAQYRKAEKDDHPRLIALDETFAGVDDKNISSMFELVEKLDFDYIMNSQVLWGCYETVKSLKISELLRPGNTDVVTVINYRWNGRERILDEQ